MQKMNFSFLKKIDKNAILVGIAIIAVVVTGVLIYANSNHSFKVLSFFGKSDKELGTEAVDYINNNKLSQTPASLLSTSEESGLVKIKIKIGTNDFDSYVTKDGRFLIPVGNGLPIDMKPAKAVAATPKAVTPSADTTTAPAQTAASVQKTAKPILEAFVVSSCPYGLQMQRAIADAVKNIPALAADIKIRYIGSVDNGKISSMHGQEEADENLRQICIREEQPAKFYNYISCYMKKATGTMANGMPLGDSPSCQASTGVDTAKLSACVSDKTRGLAYAQKDFDLSNKYNVQGSPTLILDGTQVDETSFGGRSSDGVKSIICAASKTQPSFCSTKLNTASAAASFSATYASGSGSTGSAACAPAAQ